MATKHRGNEPEELALTTFIKLTRSVEAVMGRAFDRAPLPGGLTATQFGALEALFHLGPMCQRELGSKILKTKGNISMVVEKLAGAGLVGRRRNRSDRRFQEVYLTDRGQELIASYFPRYAKAMAVEFSVLTSDEQSRLGELCKRLGLKENEK